MKNKLICLGMALVLLTALSACGEDATQGTGESMSNSEKGQGLTSSEESQSLPDDTTSSEISSEPPVELTSQNKSSKSSNSSTSSSKSSSSKSSSSSSESSNNSKTSEGFTDDCVLVVIKREFSGINKPWGKAGFPGVDNIKEICDLTFMTNIDPPMLDKDKFKQILAFYLDKRSTANVQKMILQLKQIEAVESAEPNFVMYPE